MGRLWDRSSVTIGIELDTSIFPLLQIFFQRNSCACAVFLNTVLGTKETNKCNFIIEYVAIPSIAIDLSVSGEFTEMGCVKLLSMELKNMRTMLCQEHQIVSTINCVFSKPFTNDYDLRSAFPRHLSTNARPTLTFIAIDFKGNFNRNSETHILWPVTWFQYYLHIVYWKQLQKESVMSQGWPVLTGHKECINSLPLNWFSQAMGSSRRFIASPYVCLLRTGEWRRWLSTTDVLWTW